MASKPEDFWNETCKKTRLPPFSFRKASNNRPPKTKQIFFSGLLWFYWFLTMVFRWVTLFIRILFERENPQGGPLRSLWMELWDPYKWPYKCVAGVITPISGVISLLIISRGPPCKNLWEMGRTRGSLWVGPICRKHWSHTINVMVSARFGDWMGSDGKAGFLQGG